MKLKDVFEPFRHSPFGLMYWGIPYGGTALHYAEAIRAGKPVLTAGMGAASGDVRNGRDRSIREFYATGEDPLACAVDCAHDVGMKIHFYQTVKKLGDKNRLDEIVDGEWLPRIGYFSQFDGYGWDKDHPYGAC